MQKLAKYKEMEIFSLPKEYITQENTIEDIECQLNYRWISIESQRLNYKDKQNVFKISPILSPASDIDEKK